MQGIGLYYQKSTKTSTFGNFAGNEIQSKIKKLTNPSIDDINFSKLKCNIKL